MHLRPAVKRLTVSWIVAIVIVATMTVSMAYDARQVVGPAGWPWPSCSSTHCRS